jgi:glycosyltransferase involved in cell wall biosynthesis
MMVDIICSVLNGEKFLPDFFASLEAQTHTDWVVWLRDDGSTDRTVELFRAASARDSRFRILHIGGPKLGPASSFGWVLERIPGDPRYILTADADDVWLPRKIEITHAAMQATESAHGAATPNLVHTDLSVVESDLRMRHPSFWEYTDLRPEPATLRRIAVRNVATGPTIMLNAALRTAIGTTPQGLRHHDWWYAIVAAALGKVVAIHESTVLYRQHGGNDVGARRKERVRISNLPRLISGGLKRGDVFRAGLAMSAAQAESLLTRYRDRLSETDRRFLAEYSRIPARSFLRRKLDVLRLRILPEYGLAETLGVVLRA